MGKKKHFYIYEEILKELLEDNFLEKKYIYMIMATVEISLRNIDLAQNFIQKAREEGATTGEILEAFQSSSTCWYLWD